MECKCLKYFQQFSSAENLASLWPTLSVRICFLSRISQPLIGRLSAEASHWSRLSEAGAGAWRPERGSGDHPLSSHGAHISNGPGLLLRLRSSISPTLRAFQQNVPQNTALKINILNSLLCFILPSRRQFWYNHSSYFTFQFLLYETSYERFFQILNPRRTYPNQVIWILYEWDCHQNKNSWFRHLLMIMIQFMKHKIVG